MEGGAFIVAAVVLIERYEKISQIVDTLQDWAYWTNILQLVGN